MASLVGNGMTGKVNSSGNPLLNNDVFHDIVQKGDRLPICSSKSICDLCVLSNGAICPDHCSDLVPSCLDKLIADPLMTLRRRELNRLGLLNLDPLGTSSGFQGCFGKVAAFDIELDNMLVRI